MGFRVLRFTYADVVTRSIRNALKEIDRRRQKQIEYNAAHGIEPRSIQKSIDQVRLTTSVADSKSTEGMTNDEVEMTNEEDKVALLARLQIVCVEYPKTHHEVVVGWLNRLCFTEEETRFSLAARRPE